MKKTKYITTGLLVLGFQFLAFCFAQGVFFAQPGQIVEVRLQLELPKNFALQKRSRFWLEHPFGGEMLEQSSSGQDWKSDPAHYLQTVNANIWQIAVPAGTKPGKYSLKFKALVFACDKTIGVCQRHDLRVSGRIVVGQNGRNTPVVLRFDPHKPFA